MTIELNEESYIVGMWFSSCPKTSNNWLACVIKDPDNPKQYKIWSRFRYSKGSDAWDGKDEKSWMVGHTSETTTEEDIINGLNGIQSTISPGYSDIDKIIVKGNLDKLIGLSEGKEWMNIRQCALNEVINEY